LTPDAMFKNLKLLNDDLSSKVFRQSALSLSKALSVTISWNVFRVGICSRTSSFLYVYKGISKAGHTVFFHHLQPKH